MNLQVDVERIQLAQKSVRAELLAERASAGYWPGHVASSPLATAAAISALVMAHHGTNEDVLRDTPAEAENESLAERVVQGDLCEFLLESVNWLGRHQNADGGWGDCLDGESTLATTLLVQAALRLTGIPAQFDDLMLRADQFVACQGGFVALRRQAQDNRPEATAVLASCALAGMVPWRQVPALPFEMACLPKHWQQHVQAPVEQIALPLLLALGRAKFDHDPPRNPVTRVLRRFVRTKSLLLLGQLQSDDDSFLASPLTTSFVVLCLASIGYQRHPIVQRGVEFLLTSVRGDASWPIETSVATTVTGFAIENLSQESGAVSAEWIDTAVAGDTVTNGSHDESRPVADARQQESGHDAFDLRCLEWLLRCQRTDRNPMTHAPAGGWARSEAAGALPDANDTAGALIALSHWPLQNNDSLRTEVDAAARVGVVWLLDLQQEGGGWPTYCRDSRCFQSEPHGVDVAARVLCALASWHRNWQSSRGTKTASSTVAFCERIEDAIKRGWQFLELHQSEDNSFSPLWFGNERQPNDANPVIGTALVLMAAAELDRLSWGLPQRAMRWLISSQHSNGGWGPPRAPVDYSNADKDGFGAWRSNEAMAKFCSIEETSLAVSALIPFAASNAAAAKAISAGLNWLVSAIEQDAHRQPAAIGFYPGKMWYHERLYPLVFAEGALCRAMQQLSLQQPAPARVASTT